MASRRYVVELKRSAQKELEQLPNAIIARIVAKLESLEENPRPAGCKKLKGGDAEYRVRVGEYRIVYFIEDAKVIVTITRIRHRKNVYD
ncbi:MAG: type II toxin-antitoxin system RelE/ParE family toxin [Acidobacteriota bacterium]